MRVKVKTVLLVACICLIAALGSRLAFGQTTINGGRSVSSALTVSGTTTFEGTTKTVNFESSLPGTCTAPSGSTPGEVVFRTSDNTLHACTALNTFTQIGGGGGSVTVTHDIFANRPAAGNQGDVFIQNFGEGPYSCVDDGSSWVCNAHGLTGITEPVTTGWSWVNQGTSTITTTSGQLVLSIPSSAGQNDRLRVRSIPSTGILTACFTGLISEDAGGASYGLALQESSSSKVVVLAIDHTGATPTINVVKHSNPTAYNSVYAVTSWLPDANRACLRIDWQATNRVLSFSNDGAQWHTVQTIAKNDFATTAFDNWGFYANVQNSQIATVSVWHLDIQ